MEVLCGRYPNMKLYSQLKGLFSSYRHGSPIDWIYMFHWNLQVSVQAFNDEDPQGRRTLGTNLNVKDL